MIDRAIFKERLRIKFKDTYISHEDLNDIENKIGLCKEVIKENKIIISHSKGIHKTLVEMQFEGYEENLVKFEILHEVARERFLELN